MRPNSAARGRETYKPVALLNRRKPFCGQVPRAVAADGAPTKEGRSAGDRTKERAVAMAANHAWAKVWYRTL